VATCITEDVEGPGAEEEEDETAAGGEYAGGAAGDDEGTGAAELTAGGE
jgi:hypothetical protein